MTEKEIIKELDRIPEEDTKKIENIKNLSDEELANLAGGMTPKTKKILKGLAIAGAFGTAIGATAAIAYGSGRSAGINESEEKSQKELEKLKSEHQKEIANLNAEHDKELKETGMQAAMAGKVIGNIQGYHQGSRDTVQRFIETYSDEEQVRNWATVFSTMLALNK